MKPIIKAALWGAISLAMAVPSFGQEASPQVRDARTGRVWVPDLTGPEMAEGVDQMGQPVSPNAYVNREFDPRSQNARVEGVVVQRPRAQLMGTVPITAGPSVPIVTLDIPTLQALPGRYWLSILYLTNNSAAPVEAVVSCRFFNHEREVEHVRVVLPPAAPGARLGVPVRGPRTELFVDHVGCNVISPV